MFEKFSQFIIEVTAIVCMSYMVIGLSAPVPQFYADIWEQDLSTGLRLGAAAYCLFILAATALVGYLCFEVFKTLCKGRH